jgi:hypothetical protein
MRVLKLYMAVNLGKISTSVKVIYIILKYFQILEDVFQFHQKLIGSVSIYRFTVDLG